MKILITGLIAFLGWGVLSTHFYVCEIKGFCHEQTISADKIAITEALITHDSIPKLVVPEKENMPESLLIYFAFDKSDFNSLIITDKYLNESNNFLNQNKNAKLSITGHTDAVGSDEYNQALGLRRAQSAQKYFENRGSLLTVSLLNREEKKILQIIIAQQREEQRTGEL